VCGLVHELQLPESRRHSNVEPASEELKSNVGVAFPEGLAGEESIVVFGAVRSIVQVWDAGVPSVLPAWSVARTSNVWLPSPSALVVSGLVQLFQPPPSTRHSNVDPGSLALNANVGVVSLVGFVGPLSIVVFGAVRSIVQVKLAGDASVLPETSVARTSKVCVPSPSTAVVCGVVQLFQVPESMRHSKLEPGSEELKSNVGVVSFDGLEGVESIDVFGAVRSTVQV
jgi:hypothetical protein